MLKVSIIIPGGFFLGKYYLTAIHSEANHAGSKAQSDIASILNKNGFLSIYVDAEQTKWEKRLFFRKNMLNKLSKIDENSLFLVQYPFYMGRYADFIITDTITNTFDRSAILIHDIPSLRNKLEDKYVKREINIFNKYKFVIAHNESMKKWLVENGCKSKIILLSLFDYLVDDQIDEDKKISTNKIYFAGNLEKSKFVYDKSIGNNFNVFGINHIEGKGAFTYRGVETPENLVRKLVVESGFGLVWDGNSIKSSDDYTKFNNPHKASMYLASEMPIIVWDQSALAEFVMDNKLGVTIKSLDQIDDVLNNIEDIDIIEKNVIEFAKKVRSGFFTERAINELT